MASTYRITPWDSSWSDKLKRLQLRLDDQFELRASTGMSPGKTLVRSCEVSKEAYIVTRPSGQVICVFGVAQHSDTHGTPWMVGSNLLPLHWRDLHREAINWVQIWLRDYDALSNLVCSRNRTSIKWLKRLGFHVDTERPWFLYDQEVPFYQFYQGKEVSYV